MWLLLTTKLGSAFAGLHVCVHGWMDAYVHVNIYVSIVLFVYFCVNVSCFMHSTAGTIIIYNFYIIACVMDLVRVRHGFARSSP